MKKKVTGYLLLILVLGSYLCSSVTAQVPGMRKYTLLDGFTAYSGYYMDQDNKGFLWIGTDNGGMRFDGKQFTELRQFYQPENRVILRCVPIHSNRVLLFSFAGWMYSIDPNYLTSIQTDRDDMSFRFFSVDQAKGSVLSFNAKQRKAYRFHEKDVVEYKLNHFADSIFVFNAISNWLIGNGPDENLHAYNPETYAFQKLRREDGGPINQQYGSEKSIQLEGGSHILTYNEKYNKAIIYRFNPGDSVLKFVTGIKLPPGVSDIPFAVMDRRQHLWLVFNNKMGIGYCGPIKSKAESNVLYTMPSAIINSIFTDHQNNIWLSSANNSLYFLSDKHFKNALLTNRFPMKAETPKNISGNGKELYISYAKKNVLACINDQGTQIISLNKLFGNGPGLLRVDSTTYVIWDQTLGLVDTRSRKVAYFGPRNISYKDVCLYDANGLLAATHYGVFYFPSILKDKIHPEAIFKDRASAVGVLSDKRILIGTPFGLYVKQNLHDNAQKVKDSVLQKSYVLTILPVQNGSALVGTDGNGIFLFDKHNGIKKIELPGKDMPDQIQKIYKQDGKEIYWLATNKGVHSIIFDNAWNVDQLRSYTFYDGLPSNNVRDVYVQNDTAYVTTTEGMGIIPFTDTSYLPMAAPGIFVNTVRTNRRAFLNKDSLTSLSYNENDLLIVLSAISYESLGNVSYHYRLYPLQKKWTQTVNPDIELNRLPPGTYTFQVYAVNAKGIKSLHPAKLMIRISPPFWETWWFAGLVVIIVMTIIYFIVYKRVRFVRSQEQLRSELHIFRDQALRGQMNPHFIYNSLNTIQNYILKNDKMASAFFLSKFSKLMRVTFDNTGQERVTLEKDLEALILYVELENMRFEDKIMLRIQQDTKLAASKILMPPLILQPFVENAILHGMMTKSKPGSIRLHFTRRLDTLQIIITDDGIGREEASKIKQRRQKYQVMASEKNKKSGITTTLERIEQAWGKRTEKAEFKIIDLQDQNGQASGTIVQFCLPLVYD